MNFQVPQFIETEDRIIGPLTLKQFLFLAAGAAVIFVTFFYLEFWLWGVVTILVGTIAAVFAFIKINGQPFITIFASAIGFYWKPKLYLWQHLEEKTKELKIQELPEAPKEKTQPINLKSKLDSLWEQLKTSRNSIPKREKIAKPSILESVRGTKEQFEMMRRITGEKEMARRVDYR